MAHPKSTRLRLAVVTISFRSNLGDTFTGLLLGTAIGDALGLPAENLSSSRIRRRWPGGWRMRLAFGRGMFSDDTEHALMVAQALLAHPDDPVAFQRSLAWKLRWWFAALPGGVGLATARACLKLWLGFPPGRSAVASAGGGPVMRSAILGAYFAASPERRKAFVLASSRLTHRSWQSDTAALAVAEAAALGLARPPPAAERVCATLAALSPEPEWQRVISQLNRSLAVGHTVPEFALALNLRSGVTGYSLHVAPVALYAWLRHPGDFRRALTSVLDCGGDTDTAGAILGALSGASVGKSGLPPEWIGGIWEWPRSVGFIETVAMRLAQSRDTGHATGPVRYFWPGVLLRNFVFLAIVLAHGFRRLAPPYS